AHQLARRRIAAPGVHALRPGGETLLARRARRGRSGVDGSRRGDAGQQPAARNAHSLGDRHRSGRAVFGDHYAAAVVGGPRAAEQSRDRHGRYDRRNGRCAHRPRSGRKSICPWRILGRRGDPARTCRSPRPRHRNQQAETDCGTVAGPDWRLRMGIDLTTVAIVIVILYLISSIKILREYERGVIFRLGRILGRAKGPGVILVFAPIDRIVRVSLRIDTLEVPAQDVVTRDNVTVKVNAVIYFRVIDPNLAIVEVSNFLYATSQLAQTTLRSVLGEVELDELLGQREKLNVRLQAILDQHTSPWGVKVTMVEVKQVDLAEQMIRVISRQAEA